MHPFSGSKLRMEQKKLPAAAACLVERREVRQEKEELQQSHDSSQERLVEPGRRQVSGQKQDFPSCNLRNLTVKK